MKKYIFGMLLVFSILLWGIPVNSTILWSESFDTYADWCGGRQVDCSNCASGSTEVLCTCPSGSPYTQCTANVQEWGTATPEPDCSHGISSAYGRTGKGWRINLRAYARSFGVDYENVMKVTNINSSNKNPVYLRWYMKENWWTWKTYYQKMFRIKGRLTGSQIMIPEWFSPDGSSYYFRVWFNNDNTANWTNVTSSVDNNWHCWELKFDIANKTYELWVDEVSKGVKTGQAPSAGTTETINGIELGGNQHNSLLGYSGYKTRDYDDIIISDTRVYCSSTPPPEYRVGGTVSGLNGTVVLQNNLTDDTSVSVNGDYSFGMTLTNGTNYSVTVKTQPTGQTCIATNCYPNVCYTGTINSADVSDMNVYCTTDTSYYTVGGTITGLNGTVVLQNNGGDDTSFSSSTGDPMSFTFRTPVLDGSYYSADVYTQPSGQTCTVTNKTGYVDNSNVNTILVNCENTATGGSLNIASTEGNNTITLSGGSNTLTWSAGSNPPSSTIVTLDIPVVDQDAMITLTADDCQEPTCPCPDPIVAGYCYNCGVRAATDVLSYHTKHGYGNLMTSQPSGSVPDNSTQMETLFKNMVTYTTYSDLNSGMRYAYTTMISDNGTHIETKLMNYLTAKGYTGTVTTEGGHPTFETIKNEIDNGYPVMMTVAGWNHWITIYGYDTSDNSVYFNTGHEGGVWTAYQVNYVFSNIPTTAGDDAVYIHPAH
jgi:hypothetical protein